MTVMAKPKKRKSARGRPESEDPRLPMLSFRGRRDFIEWFERLASFERIPKASLIERALIEYARNHGFDEEAPER